MALNSRSGLAFLLIPLLAGQLQTALAADPPQPVATAKKSVIAARTEVSRKVDANWDHDLFSIFREEEELKESELVAALPKPKPTSPALVPAAAVKKSEPAKATPKKVVKLKALKLQGIVVADDHEAALVNGKVVRQGEVVEGWTISRIDRHGILATGPDEAESLAVLADSRKASVRSQAQQE